MTEKQQNVLNVLIWNMLTDSCYIFPLIPADKCLFSRSNCVTTVLLPIIFHSLRSHISTIQYSRVWSADISK